VSDIINLLPDHIANQIAAGEVIQRPASAVKEMLENAVDAGATQIHLLIKDAGKELIKVIDNGKGMSTTDARMSFERHATSKIRNIEDLFSICTMGFRGEALASIAAVAQVELKTKQHTDEAGTYIQIENSTVLKQEPCGMPSGTSLSVKNLFYNVPARRNFLKSNTTEVKNIIDEFTRVAMAFPQIGFRLTNNDTDIFALESGNQKQRIVALLGSGFNAKLAPLEQNTEYVNINGFIGTPQATSKTRGNQFFFVNNRFIKSAYLNHAVNNAYQSLIAKDEFPAFVLFLDINPEKVDANVHPTKQEIKFEDEKIIYAFVNSAVKHAISKNSIAPSIDFELDAGISQLSSITQPFTNIQRTATQKEFLFNSFTQAGSAHLIDKKDDVKNWKELYKIGEGEYTAPSMDMPVRAPMHDSSPIGIGLDNYDDNKVQLLFHQYILYPKSAGFLLIDAVAALERIAYDQLVNVTLQEDNTIQKLLHPQTLELSATDALLLSEIIVDLKKMGYEVEHFGAQTFIIQGVPADVKHGDEVTAIEQILEQIKHSSTDIKLDKREKLLRTLAYQKANRTNLQMHVEMLKEICIQLFTSSQPTYTPRGKKIMLEISKAEIEKRFLNAE
jgi:DNA mismatch repair protein MutL